MAKEEFQDYYTKNPEDAYCLINTSKILKVVEKLDVY
jgi:peptide methionine sulfoxide reductase MsrA